MSEDEVTLFDVTLTRVMVQAMLVDVTSCRRLLAIERTKWKRQERDLKQQIERLLTTVDNYKQELRKLGDDCHVADLVCIKECADEKHHPAVFLLE